MSFIYCLLLRTPVTQVFTHWQLPHTSLEILCFSVSVCPQLQHLHVHWPFSLQGRIYCSQPVCSSLHMAAFAPENQNQIWIYISVFERLRLSSNTMDISNIVILFLCSWGLIPGPVHAEQALFYWAVPLALWHLLWTLGRFWRVAFSFHHGSSIPASLHARHCEL